jgi:hypothetical protein
MHTRNLCTWSVLLLTAQLIISGCGSCPAVQQERDVFAGRTELKKKSGPHLRLEVSTKTINERLNQQLGQAGTKELGLPGLGDFSRYVGKYTLKLKRLELRFDKKRAASLTVHVGLRSGRSELMSFRLKANAPLVFDKARHRVRMSFRADMFESVEVRPSRGAADRLTDHLRGLVPSSVRRFLPKREISALGSRVVARLSDRLYQEVRKELLTPAGEFASLTFRMPDVPIDEVGIVTVGDVIAFEVRTTLQADGLAPLRNPKLASGYARLSVSTDTLAELGNWGMYNGKIPNRYSMEGKAQKDGAFSAGLRWSKSKRPMKVHLFSSPDDNPLGCMYIRAGATPKLSLSKKKLKVGFKDGKLETIIGPPLVNEVAGILGISNRAFAFTKGIALKQSLKVGSKKLAVKLDKTKLNSHVLSFDLAIR